MNRRPQVSVLGSAEPGSDAYEMAAEAGVHKGTYRIWIRETLGETIKPPRSDLRTVHQPRRDGKFASSAYGGLTKQEYERRFRAVQTMRARGVCLTEIARHLGLKEDTLRAWVKRHNIARTAPRVSDSVALHRENRKPVMERPCARCGRTFFSERADGAWLRRCQPCRTSESAESPYAPSPGGSTGRRTQAVRPSL